MSGTETGPEGHGDLRALVEQLAEENRRQVAHVTARVTQLAERDRVRAERDAELTALVEQLAERNAALAAEVWSGREPARPRLSRRLAVGLASVVALLVALAPLAALAVVDLFGDVPTGAQFHDEINAIARAGITTGCSAGTPPNFCPDELVTRKAMAAFMSRGFGRVAGKSLPLVDPVSTSSSSSAVPNWNTTITPGLPANALSGAAGFLKIDASVTVSVTSGTTTCFYDHRLLVDGVFQGSGASTTLTFDGNNVVTTPITAVARITGSSAKTVEVRVRRYGGDCAANAFGNLSIVYEPFGSTGTNTL